jgi:hypothetical protein
MEKLDALQIPFSLNPGRRLIKPLMEGQSLDWALRQLNLEKRKKDISPNVGLLKAFEPYARNKKVDWFRECEVIGYPIGRGVVIPVRPAGFWSERRKLCVLWPQCWKGRTLDPQQRAIFGTILRDAFFVGDFKDARLEWVDLQEKFPREGRSLEVLPGDELGYVSQTELGEYLNILLTAFEEYSVTKAREKGKGRPKQETTPAGLPLFDG